jgi:hypothetical protein
LQQFWHSQLTHGCNGVEWSVLAVPGRFPAREFFDSLDGQFVRAPGAFGRALACAAARGLLAARRGVEMLKDMSAGGRPAARVNELKSLIMAQIERWRHA